jgi:hypothetical protein
MAIYRIGAGVVLGVSLPLERFSAFATEHRRRFDATGSVEALGQRFRQSDFQESDLEPFITAVCAWGGYAGIGRRILNRNSSRALCGALRDASALLSRAEPDVEGALARLNNLHSLGSPSFASKHLRFLRPDICPVLDSVLRDALPYAFDPEGYAIFAEDCRSIGATLQIEGADNPWQRAGGAWFAADVEAALYVHFNGWA